MIAITASETGLLADDTPQLDLYILTDKLGESLQASVYKGFHKHVPEYPLVIKFPKLASNSKEQERHLRQKIERLKVLHDPRVSTPLALENHRDRQFFVQPWFNGQPLNHWAKERQPISLNDFFALAITLADILHNVHEAGITHGGIKPHNILLQPGTLTMRLIDFITPLDVRDVSHFIYDPEFVRNTLAYTSPEQTGRINYRVDFSTDLYALGIVFYELLTGQLPFFSLDPLELIHSHLAEEAAKVQDLRPNLPVVVGEIVAKLTVKQPEKRYQSAAGLLADLLRCRDELLAYGQISPFAIAQQDRHQRVIFISKMVGRNAESASIRQLYQQVLEGRFRSVLISGLSGIGKTRLIQELQKPLVKNRGYFSSGKFDQYQKNIPYSSLIQALRNLIRTFLTESDEQVAHWRSTILDALEQNGRVIAEVVPELDFIIGQQPEVAHLPPVEARQRFNNLFGRFLGCLASAENPLVFFIDDLQWCDSATFEFLQYLFANPHEHPYLLLIGAYRHNEVGPDHPLTKLIRSAKEQQSPLSEIRLEALSDADCHEMVAYILDSSLDSTRHLANFITTLTDGNPLFVSESLAWLYNEHLLITDQNQHWHWDMQRIRDAQMPATVVELFSSKVQRLPPATSNILEVCACIGNRFASENVALVLDIGIQALFEDLKPVLSLGMLLENKHDLQFVHDRVQEAVLNRIETKRRHDIHWHIGNRLLANLPVDADPQQQDNLFTIAAHLNLGCPNPLPPDTAYKLAEINFQAGDKALEALAGDAANDFFLKAYDYLPEDSWNTAYDLTFRIHQRLAKTHLMRGRYEQSEILLDQLIVHAQTDLDKAEALAEQTTSLSSFGNFRQAIATANRGLAYFDKAIPEAPDQARIKLHALMARIDQYDDVWQTILKMPFTRQRQSKIELAFYSELIPDLYMSGLVDQLYLSAAQSTLHCLEGGMDESVIYSFSIMGLNLGEQGRFQLAFLYEDLAHDLCAQYPNTFGATRGMNGIVWCNMHSRSHPAAIVDYCHKAIQCGRNCGDLYNAGLSYGPLMWNLQVQGYNLRDIEEAAEECLQFSRKNQLSFSVSLAEAVLAGWVGPMKPGYQAIDMTQTLANWQENHYVAASGSYFALLSFAQYFLGDYQAAAQSLQQVETYLHGMTDNVLKRLWFVFRILNLLRLAETATAVEARIAPWLEQLATWATLGPLLQPYVLLVHAELARFRGQFRQARNLYLDAIAEAHLQNYRLLNGHIHELLADLTAEHQLGNPELFYAEARRLYRLCRADLKSQQLQQRHPYQAPATGARRATATGSSRDTLPNLDINYLMKSSMALSAEIDLNHLMEKILAVVLECSSAQRGYLLIKEHNEWQVKAEHHAGKKHRSQKRPYGLGKVKEICRAVINYVQRTHEKVVLHNASNEGNFQNSPEVQSLQLRSILCLPMLKQGEMIGMLYLENRLTEGVFTPEKINMTELLTSQAAISLENARLLEQSRRAYRQLQENQEHMLQMEKLSALGTLVGGVAHEINNPLMGIMNFVEFALDHSEDPKSQQVLGQAMQQIQRIKKIVTNMLVFVRNKALPVGMCSITTVAEEVLLLLSGEIRKADIELIQQLPSELPEIACPAEHLQQILINLVLNARDALRETKPAQIILSASFQESRVELCVSDNGPGIADEIQNRMFDPFFTTKPPGQGTGLGLSVTRRLVQDVGGSIKVESRVGEGCLIRLQFPAISQ